MKLLVVLAALSVIHHPGHHHRHHRARERPQVAVASWYQLTGNRMANGKIMTPQTWGVANKAMRFGTLCTFWYRGHVAAHVPVVDRGPYSKGRTFDLSATVARALHLDGVDIVHYVC